MKRGLVRAWAAWHEQSVDQKRERLLCARRLRAMAGKRLQTCLLAWHDRRMHARAGRTTVSWVHKYAALLCEACLSESWERWRGKAAAAKMMRIKGQGQRSKEASTSSGCVDKVPRDYYLRMTIETQSGEMRVKSVEPGSACEGVLRQGDHILSIDGQRPRDPAHLRVICRGLPGTIVAIKYVRAPTSKWRSEEVLEHLLLRWVNQDDGQPVFTKYIPATPRELPVSQAAAAQARHPSSSSSRAIPTSLVECFLARMNARRAHTFSVTYTHTCVRARTHTHTHTHTHERTRKRTSASTHTRTHTHTYTHTRARAYARTHTRASSRRLLQGALNAASSLLLPQPSMPHHLSSSRTS
jgi:hypothetical protein